MFDFTVLDYVILGVICLSGIISVFRGFIREVSSIFCWIVSYFVASRFYDDLAGMITFVDDDLGKRGLASIILFIGTFIIVGLISNFLVNVSRKVGVSGFDRILGVVFGIVRGVLLVCAVLAVVQILGKLHLLNHIREYSWFSQSVLIPELDRIVNWFFIYIGTPETGV